MGKLITIKDAQKAISDAEEIATSAVELSSVVESIDYIVGEVGSYWEQTQTDAQAFKTGLETNVKTLDSIVECNKEFSQIVEKYAESQSTTGQSTIS